MLTCGELHDDLGLPITDAMCGQADHEWMTPQNCIPNGREIPPFPVCCLTRAKQPLRRV
jgi:hypothetical protein